jgi:RHH-type proline utilization regulon transcriptional repressor/proline dehydrogenase/delta 1-pyrroline-5-carboxylate dehydrogenase
MGKSAVGPGIKAGGPNYVAPLMTFSPTGGRREQVLDRGSKPDLKAEHSKRKLENDGPLSELRSILHDEASRAVEDAAGELNRTIAAINSYDHWAREEFHQPHDHFRLVGEDNIRRYLPVRALRIRVHGDDSLFDIFARAAAARAAGCLTTVSVPPDLGGPAAEVVNKLDLWTEPWAGAIEFVEESDEQLAEAIRNGQTDRLRYASNDRVAQIVEQAAADALQYIAAAPVVGHGRVELLWYFQEQSLTHVYHRYGNLGLRADEEREEVL